MRDMENKGANTVVEETRNEKLFISSFMAHNEESEAWYIDSGCSTHMTSQEELFTRINDNYSGKVVFGDDRVSEVKGKGIVAIPSLHGKKKFIDDTLLTPALKKNLLSIGQMMEQNYKLVFDNNECLIMDKLNHNAVVAREEMTEDRIFKLSFDSSKSQSLNATKEMNNKIWHLRMGHLNFQSLVLLRKKNMVNGLPYIKNDNEVCEECIFGKQHRESFSKGTWKASEHLVLVHLDLCGPMETMSFGKARYFVTFIDDFSRKTSVYFLQEKYEVCSHFLEFKALVEKQSGFKILTLRIDNGGEYRSNEFLNYCMKNGIKREFTNFYSPQQNGVAERKTEP
jgi:hypothetical protein